MVSLRDFIGIMFALALYCWLAYHVGYQQGRASVRETPAVMFTFPNATMSSSSDLWLPPGGRITATKGGQIVVKKGE